MNFEVATWNGLDRYQGTRHDSNGNRAALAWHMPVKGKEEEEEEEEATAPVSAEAGLRAFSARGKSVPETASSLFPFRASSSISRAPLDTRSDPRSTRFNDRASRLFDRYSVLYLYIEILITGRNRYSCWKMIINYFFENVLMRKEKRISQSFVNLIWRVIIFNFNFFWMKIQDLPFSNL